VKKSIVLWLSVNNAMHFLMIGTPGDRRVILFQETLARLGLPSAQLVSYQALITGEVTLPELITPTTIVRIESPGKSVEMEHLLLMLGANESDPEGDYYERLSPSTLAALPHEKGRLLASRQWYLGFSALMHRLAGWIPAQQTMNRPDDILLMFDKRRCHTLLDQRGISVPPALPPVYSYDELTASLQERCWSRVFLKLAHGSSASGTIAYRYSGNRHQAFTTVEVASHAGEVRLYNTRRIRKLESRQEIAQVVNALCRHRIHVEQWIPKATYGNRVFDLRMVVIDGQAMHTVARLSHSPMTNLHLLNERGDLAAILERIGPERWQAAQYTCECAANLFDSLYSGIDLLFTTDYRHHVILEMNAFGDLLPGLLYHDQDTYSAEILVALRRVGMEFNGQGRAAAR
jgi:glutathione synthase/RimK-type ligase-like ATP-grasp enzyme